MALSTQNALVYIMVIVSAADRAMADAEFKKIGSIVRNFPIFDGFDEAELPEIANQCAELLASRGLAGVLDEAVQAVPPELVDTVYAVAIEVAAADLDVPDEETRVLEVIRDRFGVPALTVAAIEASARARHRRA